MTEPSLEQNMAAARHEHLVPGREIHMQGMRGHRFCEVGLIAGTGQDNAIANIWNTTGACDPTPEQFDALDPDTIARETEPCAPGSTRLGTGCSTSSMSGKPETTRPSGASEAPGWASLPPQR